MKTAVIVLLSLIFVGVLSIDGKLSTIIEILCRRK